MYIRNLISNIWAVLYKIFAVIVTIWMGDMTLEVKIGRDHLV